MSSQQFHLDVRPVAGALGAEVHGLDVRGPLSDEQRAALRAAWLEHLVLFFPGQHLNSAELKAFGATWGELEDFKNSPVGAAVSQVLSDGDPGVVELAASDGNTADFWHTDLTHMEIPPLGSVLSMVKLPPVGGDTMWSNQYLAYESLSAPMRNLLDDLTAIHEHPRMHTRAEHPVVRVHPETDRRFLNVNCRYTTRVAQLSLAESDALLGFLSSHSAEPRFTVRYRWSEGTAAIWDNRCTQHMVVSDFVGERIIQRVTLVGETIEKLNSPWEHFRPSQNTISSRSDLVDNVQAAAY